MTTWSAFARPSKEFQFSNGWRHRFKPLATWNGLRSARSFVAVSPASARSSVSYHVRSFTTLRDKEQFHKSDFSGRHDCRRACYFCRHAGQSDGRRRSDVFNAQHRPECGQFEGSHDPGRRGQGSGPGRHIVGQGPVHRLRPDQCGVRQASRRHRRNPGQAGEQGDARPRS